MKTTITARHCEVTQDLRTQVEGQLENLLAIFDRVSRADVVFAENGPTPTAEITVQFHRQSFNSKGEGISHEQAFNIAYEKAERQLRKFKDKMIGRRDAKELKEQQAVTE